MSFIEKYIVEPFKYATSDWIKVLIGTLLGFFMICLDWALMLLLGPFSFIFILGIDFFVSIVILGYYIGVIKNTLKGLDILPDWSNIVELLTDGILYSIALFILLLILSLPVIVLLIGGSFFIVGEIIGYSSYSDLWNILSFLSILAILLLLYIVVTSLVLWIYIPLATVNFAKKGFFGFFKIRDILKKISLEYIGILLLYTLFYGIYSLISPIILKIILAIFFLTLPPIAILVLLVALLIESIVIFVLGIMFYRAVAKYYREKELKN